MAVTKVNISGKISKEHVLPSNGHIIADINAISVVILLS